MKEIRGNTFPVRAKLAELGGKWDKAGKCWLVPDDKAAEAEALVKTPVATVAKAAGHGFYVRQGDEWAVCIPAMGRVGDEVSIMTKAGKVKRERLGAYLTRREAGYVFALVRDAAEAGRGYRTTPKRLPEVGLMPDPGELAADRWNEGGGVA